MIAMRLSQAGASRLPESAPGRGSRAMSELTIIIPTFNRREILLGTLRSLRLPDGECEVVVVDDGSTDGTAPAVQAIADRLPIAVRVEHRPNGGAGAARNRGLELAQGEICLFLGDDMRPAPGTIDGHLEFHRRNPGVEDALMHRVEWAPDPSRHRSWSGWRPAGYSSDSTGSPSSSTMAFCRAATSSARTPRPRRASSGTAGVSTNRCGRPARTSSWGCGSSGGDCASPTIPGWVAQHLHPTDLTGALRRMRGAGISRAMLRSRVGLAAESPRRPGIRHRVGSAALTGATVLRIPNERLRRETWRFLCHEAHREGFWAIDAKREGSVRIGGTLARLARRDPRTRMPT